MHRKVAKGDEPYLGGVQAADMLELTWNEEVALGAQLWANQCLFKHDRPDTCGGYIGQNLAIAGIYHTAKNRDANWKKSIDSWYNEVCIVFPPKRSVFCK